MQESVYKFEDAGQKVKAATRHIFRMFPFFINEFARMKLAQDTSIPVAMTDSVEIRYNPDEFMKRPFAHVVFILLHEHGHVLLKHPIQRRERDPRIFRIAAEYAVNLMLSEFGGLDMPSDTVIDFRFKGMNTYQIYEILKAEAEGLEEQRKQPRYVVSSGENSESDGSNGSASDEETSDPSENETQSQEDSDSNDSSESEQDSENGNEGENESESEQDYEGEDKDENEGKSDAAPEQSQPEEDLGEESFGSYGTFEDFKPENEQTAQEEADQQSREIDQSIISAIHNMKFAGKEAPAHFSRMMTEILYPAIDYKEVLKDIVEDIMATDYSWERLNKSYLQRNLLVPSIAKREIPHIVIAIDTSSSISQDEYNKFISDAAYVVESFQESRVTILGCDTTVGQNIYELMAGEILSEEQYLLGGGGGTKFMPVFEYIEENDIDPTVLLYYTDGENFDTYEIAEMGEPQYPVVWVSTLLRENDYPFGHVVMCDQK